MTRFRQWFRRSLARLLARLIRPANYAHIGAWAEALALAHLRASGLRLLERNYLCRGGELDLIMRQGDCLVLIEVRYRRSGGARASVDARKRRRLQHCAEQYLARYPRLRHRHWRFDIFTVEGDPDAPTTHWWRQIF